MNNTMTTLDDIFTWVKKRPGDIEQHADKIRELASEAQHVTAFTRRGTWAALLGAGRPPTLIVYQLEGDQLLDHVHDAVEREVTGGRARVFTSHVGPGADSLKVGPVAETDLLVFDTAPHFGRMWDELARHASSVRRRIMICGTGEFGEVAQGKIGPGPLPALRRFMRDRPEWSVIHHAHYQQGITVISRDPADKPKLPGMLTMAANLAKAMARHVADGAKLADLPVLEARLNTCMTCDQRRDDRCTVCGCFLAEKAKLRTAECPLGKWL